MSEVSLSARAQSLLMTVPSVLRDAGEQGIGAAAEKEEAARVSAALLQSAAAASCAGTAQLLSVLVRMQSADRPRRGVSARVRLGLTGGSC